MSTHLLSLKVPGEGGPIDVPAPSGIPTTGLSGDGGRAIGWGVSLLILTAVLLALGFLVYGGITWITSGGDKQKVENARHTIVYSIVGLIICFLSFFLVAIFGNLFGVNLLHPSL
jgi:hypothetical protein